MSFKVLVLPELFDRLPSQTKENMRSALNELKEPFPGTGRGSKKEIKGADDVAYRLRVGNYRVFYRIDMDRHNVYVFDILTAEKAHKKYGRL
ncbi:type II toxin-antitoxin system RelE family toxin [Methanolobus bombayensis]|uniref:type II toxin-antitoxin system RelE family toxin n=1 Tax=Methanolobus bombayensis TaxID=38023 RepID=UPI001AE7599C|nr:type II toxin-antitoxin system RelE/ParE family toxin [Methanolobus bombayensis]MBP1910643.1 mRNA-degrading endonuclease RelE of RelBE toxin-antitoxin system [Methanolobus bombayensis]